ncbi:hypothetical protein REPUB_Repub15cG0008200 [Reevesia pubescens]
MALTVPRFIVLRSNEKNEYLGYIRKDVESNGYLCFMETQAVSSYAKFEVETSTQNDLVHIRSCQNNKYWARNAQNHCITTTAVKPEEDQSKESCTLFKPISVDSVKNTMRIMHVQSGCYLCLWPLTDDNVFNRCVLSLYNVFDGNGRDIFTIIDWDSLIILPRYVAFKGDIDQYLCLSQIEGHPYLQFTSNDIGDSTVACEIFVNHDGNIRIKTISSNKFWRCSPDYIWADSDDTSSNNNDTLFRPFKVDDQTIGLFNLGNNYFCKRYTVAGKISCLCALTTSITREAKLRVEEPVLTRSIYNVKYNLDNSRIYNEASLIVARNSASNYTKEHSTLDVKLSYTNTKTTNWKANISLKLGMKVTYDIGLPLIFEGKVELSGELQGGFEWGEITTSTNVLEEVYKVVVPPMTKVTVNLIVTNGKCDVPFTFIQRDTLYDGRIVKTEIPGGTYTGSNYYNFDFQTKEEPLS